MKFLRVIVYLFNWCLGLFFLIVGFSFFITEDFLSGAALIAASFFITPAIRWAVYSVTKNRMPWELRSLFVFLFFAASVVFISYDYEEENLDGAVASSSAEKQDKGSEVVELEEQNEDAPVYMGEGNPEESGELSESADFSKDEEEPEESYEDSVLGVEGDIEAKKDLMFFGMKALGLKVTKGDIKNISSLDEIYEVVATGVNINGHLCARVTELRDLERSGIYEATCIDYRGGSSKSKYILDANNGVAFAP